MQYFHEPTPHIVLDPFIEPEVYSSAVFPDLPEKKLGRIGRDLYPGESRYKEVITLPGWKNIYEKFTSEAFVKEVLGLFSDAMEEQGCLVDPSGVYLEPYQESREETETSPLSTDYPVDALFNRFDFQAIGASYGKGIHVDWPRRIVGGVLFCCSAEEEEMEGGSFSIFADQDFQNDRICHEPKMVKEFIPRHNLSVLFLNANTGFHGPTKITRISGLRKWIYYSISSRRDIWPFQVTEEAKHGHKETYV